MSKFPVMSPEPSSRPRPKVNWRRMIVQKGMNKPPGVMHLLRRAGLHWFPSPLLGILAAAFWLPSCVWAQAVAEYSAVTSNAGMEANRAKNAAPLFPALSSQTENKLIHLPLRNSPSPEVVNRRALEERAGKDAAKLLLRSLPTGAQVWIDGAFVGNAPMLLLLAPEKYVIEMRGARLEYASQSVALLPRETKETVLRLATKYPAQVRLR